MGQSQSQQRQPPRPPKLTVLTKEDATTALANANRIDEFRDILFLDEVNLRARAGCDYTPMDGPDLLLQIPTLRHDTYICWMSPSAEAGMPHTRAPNLICMPLYWKQGSIQETIKHELIHLDQRARPELWVRWAVQEGWTLVNEDEIPERWLRQCRLNPDTMAYRFWAFRGRWVPLPMFERADMPKLREIRVRWWDRKTGTLLLEPPREVTQLIDGIINPEHPFEIAAYKGIQL
jgi:hypothetical protein